MTPGRIGGALMIIIFVLAGCAGPAHEPIPSGAQVVRVTVTESNVRLDPAVVPPGDVYLVLDSPLDGSIAFVQGKPTADAVPGPLSDDDLARLKQGDTGGTEIGGLDAGGCDAGQNAAARGQMGPCGNVMMVALVEGKYAVLGGGPDVDPATGLPPPMAVLTVQPAAPSP